MSTIAQLTDELVRASGRGPGDGAVVAVRQAATALTAGDGDMSVRAQAWRTAVAALPGQDVADVEELLTRALGLPDVPGLLAGLGSAVVRGDARLLAGHDVGGRLGPLSVRAHLPALTVRSGTRTVAVAVAPPARWAADLDAGPLRVAGGLAHDRGGVSGLLSADLGAVQAGAGARLRTAPSPGFAAVLGARLTPGIQVGFGFEVSSVGGAVGVGFGLDVDALRGALGSGAATGLFFPADGRDPASRLPLLETVFQRRPGSTVAGPAFEVTWLKVAGTTFLRLSLVALLELPRGRLVVLGRAAVQVPPVLSFRLDVLGEVDPPHGVVALDLAITEGRVLGILRAGGTMALRVRTSAPAHSLVTIGGFFPGYRPDVPGLPEQRRISLGPDLPLPITFRFEGYLALTDGTFQAGAAIELRFSAGIVVRGHVAFDAIAQLDPFHLHARLEGGIEVRALGVTLAGVRFSGTIDGPGPLVLAGEVSVRVLGIKAGWRDRFVLERSPHGQPPRVRDLVGFVTTGLERPQEQLLDPVALAPSSLRPAQGVDPHVVVDAPERDPDDRPVVAAHGAVVWTQTVAPFDTPVARVAGRRLTGVRRLRLLPSPGVTPGPTEQFAPASFVDADQATLLALPAYERLASGFEVRPGVADGRRQDGPVGYVDIYRQDAPQPQSGLGWQLRPALLDVLAGVWAAPVSSVGEPRLVLRPEPWEVRVPGRRPSRASSRTTAVLDAPHMGDPDGTRLPGRPRPVATASASPAVHVGDLTTLWEPRP